MKGLPRRIPRPAAPIALAILVMATGCGGSGDAPGPARYVERLLNVSTDVAWVGAERCRTCHLTHATTFAGTGMGRSFGPMEADRLVGDWTDDNTFVDEATGLHYEMLRRDDGWYQREFLVDDAGRPRHVEEHRLVWWVGSSNHNRGYFFERDGRLFQAPICWYPQAETWDFCPGFEIRNEHFAREVSQSCVFCHNGRMVLEEGARNRYREPIPHGIGCERCHGPGELHVARWEGGEATPGGEIDTTIVNPRRMGKRERDEICAQCHLGDARATERVLRHGASLVDHRPGAPLVETLVPFRYVHPTEWDFGLSSQADRMMYSPCFVESGGELECLTCHDPHVTTYAPDLPEDRYRQACLSCHEVAACTADDAARAATSPLADDCVQCHMRFAEPDDQRMTAFTDHYIRRDIDLDGRDHRAGFEIEPVYSDSFAALSAGERAYHEARASMTMGGDAPADVRRAMRERADALFGEAIEAGLDSRDVRFYRAKNRFDRGDLDGAIPELRRALELAPADADAALLLGQLLLARGETDEARGLFTGILERDPDHVGALAESGRLAFATGDREAAEASFRRAAALQPENADLQVNWGMVLASRGEMAAAAERAEVAVTLDPDSVETWTFYANVMRSTGRTTAAERAVRRVERLTRDSPPSGSERVRPPRPM